MRRCWAILTGAYPPAPGGVADYTRVVARALAAAGDEVHVITAGSGCDDGGVRVHAAGFAVSEIARVGEILDRLPGHREVLVQYTPYAFGASGFNLALPVWLGARARRERVTVMFHEVMYPVRQGQPLAHNLLGRAHRLMASMLVRSARRALVATPRWGQILRESCGATCPIIWAPVPSNLPTAVDPGRAAETRSRLAARDEPLVGHFGTYGRWISEMLRPIVLGLRHRTLLVGRGSHDFRARLVAREPSVADRLIAAGELEPAAAAEHLAACDLIVQPYPDGVTTRRSSVMAGLALGAPVVTNAGELTEPLWAASGAVALARGADASSIMRLADALAVDAARRAELSRRAGALYRDRFDVAHAVRIVRGAPCDTDSPSSPIIPRRGG